VIITAEAVAASAVVLLASATLSAYLADWIGLTIVPSAILVVSLAASAGTFVGAWRRAARDRSSLAAFVVIVAAVMAWLLWLAGRDLLPPGTGPDLTHHLLLVGYIEEHWRLPHDPQLGPFLGEMVDYSPGAHLLAALAGAWTRTDGLHAVYPLVAFTVALKCGLVFLNARRLVNSDVPRIPFAVMAVLLLLLPRAYFTGSFAQHSFLAQVVAEVFAVALWWALVIWDVSPGMLPIVFFAIVGAAAFLTWPVWIGPPLVLLAMCLAARRDVSAVERAKQFILVAVAIGGVAAAFTASRGRSAGIVAAAGFVLRPAPAVFGWAFLLVCGAGVCVGLFSRRTRTVPLFLSAIALQAGALFLLAQARGSAAPYLALKMVYLAIYPLAVAGAVGTAVVWRTMVHAVTAGIGDAGVRPVSDPGLTLRWDQRGSRSRQILQSSRVVLWLLLAVFGIIVARSALRVPRPTPTISESLLRAGRWARANANAGCVDYLVADGYTAYWLHLAVLGNARAAARSLENDTYELPPALVRWIEPGGLPYAIVEDFSALPKDIRDNVDVAAQFGRTTVVKRRGAVSCAP
jgi:hypothetical protein